MTECSGEKQSALETALKNSADLATKAATAAESGDDARFKEYFMTTDAQTRSTVVERLQAVAKESSSTTSGGTSYYCEDTLGYCEPNVLAWTLPSQNIIANCDIYYSELPPLASGCHDQDQATTTLHEFTHAPGAYSPGTDDLGYGYDAATALSAEEALNNADTYALFANGMFTSPLIGWFRVLTMYCSCSTRLLVWDSSRLMGCFYGLSCLDYVAHSWNETGVRIQLKGWGLMAMSNRL